MTTGASVSRDRGSALSGFIQTLCASPSGDAAARAMVLGALGPLTGIAGQIYGLGRPGTLELLGNFGWPTGDASAFRALAINLPLPACDAFTTVSTVALPWADLAAQYTLLAAGLDETPPTDLPGTDGLVVACVPIVWAQAPVGVVVALLGEHLDAGPGDWDYLDGVAGALALWLLEQRGSLIDTWRKAAPLPHAEVAISPIQHRILELVGDGKSDAEIAEKVGLSAAMVRKDLKEVLGLMGTEDRRTAAGRAREIGLLSDRRARDGTH